VWCQNCEWGGGKDETNLVKETLVARQRSREEQIAGSGERGTDLKKRESMERKGEKGVYIKQKKMAIKRSVGSLDLSNEND